MALTSPDKRRRSLPSSVRGRDFARTIAERRLNVWADRSRNGSYAIPRDYMRRHELTYSHPIIESEPCRERKNPHGPRHRRAALTRTLQ
jgi:hypothetical protein